MNQVIQNFRTGILEVVEVPDPVVRPGAILVRTAASVVSAGTERHLVEMAKKTLLEKALARPDLVRRVWDKVRSDGIAAAVEQVKQRLDTPMPLGYSASGVVVGIGEGVSGFRIGDRVACGGQGVAVHAEFLSVPPTLAVSVSEQADIEQAAFAMVGAIPLHAIRLAQVQPGEWVVVIGLGLLGLLATQILKAWGYKVIGMDVVKDKLDLAQRLGASVVGDSSDPGTGKLVEEITGGEGADAVLITASTSSNYPLELAARLARVKGRVVVTGLVGLKVPRHLFFERELELVVSRASGPGLYDPEYEIHGADYPYPYVRWTHGRNMAEFLNLVANGSVDLKTLITHRFPISRAAEAYAALRGGSGESPIGIVLQYSEETLPKATVPILRSRDNVGDIKEANSEVHVGLIGAGLFARTTLLPEIKKLPGVRLVGVATTTGSSAGHAARSFNFDYATADFQQVIEDPTISCVVIATRHDSHARLAAAALRAGKDVFVEKPLALSIDELLEVAEAWRAGGRRLMVGFNRRHSSHAKAAKVFLEGAAGPVLLHCRVNAGDVPLGSWVNDPRSGGDRIRGELCHFVDIAHYLVGELSSSVEAVGLPPGRKSDPTEDLVAILHFSSGSVANLVYTARGHRSLAREWIEGFRGGRVAVIENFRTTKFYGPGAPHVHRTWRLDRGYKDELSAWFQVLRDGGPAPVPFVAYAASTLATFSVCDAISSRSRVDLDPSVLAQCSAPR